MIVVLTMLFSAISFDAVSCTPSGFIRTHLQMKGYITWTLPASPLTQLWAKILSASIWYVLDLTICFAAAWFLISGDNIQSALERIKPDFQAALGMSFSSFCGLVVFFSFVGILSCVLFIYTSIAIGQLVPAHRIIVSIAVYFILNLITQIISIGVSIITSVFPDYVFSPAQTSFSEYFFQMLLIGTCTTTVLAIAGYFITYRILQRNVNLI